jgi:hypothetical protein
LWTANALFSKCHSLLAQEFFPPEGKTISYYTNRPGMFGPIHNEWSFKSHEWQPQNAEKVMVHGTYTSVQRRPNVIRKLD